MLRRGSDISTIRQQVSDRVEDGHPGVCLSKPDTCHFPGTAKPAASIEWSVDGFFGIAIFFQIEFACPLEGCAFCTSPTAHSPCYFTKASFLHLS